VACGQRKSDEEAFVSVAVPGGVWLQGSPKEGQEKDCKKEKLKKKRGLKRTASA
jgi:hypothetical protein